MNLHTFTKPKCATLLRILITILVACKPGQAKPFNSEVKICSKIYLSRQTELNDTFGIEQLRLRLKHYINGCQYVNGDVELKSFGVSEAKRLGRNFYQLQTDFFDSIEEIGGNLIIFDVNLAVLEFKNLRVVRGKNIEMSKQYDNESISITYIRWPMSLRLPKLIAIYSGNVVLYGPMHWSLYGYLKYKVDWQFLFKDVGKTETQRFVESVSRIIGCKTAECDEIPICSRECMSSSSSNCWSEGSQGCQSNKHGCENENQCNSCFRDRRHNSRPQCCHRYCLGGCSGGSGPENCNACRSYNREGSCSIRCSGDEDSGAPQQLALINHLCVKSCPLPFLNRYGYCVRQCPNNEMPYMKRCVVCFGCNPTCVIEKTPVLLDFKAQELKEKDCKILSSVTQLQISNRGIRSRDSLETLKQISVFYGSLMIRGLNQLGVDRIDFLPRLQFVSDELMIIRMKLKYLGLGRLKYARTLMLMDISGLCRRWYPRNHIESFKGKLQKVTVVNVTFDSSSEECREARCHSDCGTSECWGPSADMCVGDIWED